MSQGSLHASACEKVKVIKRNGSVVPFDSMRINRALARAIAAEFVEMDAELLKRVEQVTQAVEDVIAAEHISDKALAVERIQDIVEEQLMAFGLCAVAKRYILYREDRRRARLVPSRTLTKEEALAGHASLYASLVSACSGIDNGCSPEQVLAEALKQFHEGITPEESHQALVLAARSLVEQDLHYAYVGARLLFQNVYKKLFNLTNWSDPHPDVYRKGLFDYIRLGVERQRLDPALMSFDLKELSAALDPQRDHLFAFTGAQILYDRYLLKDDGQFLEAPQYLWMRVAMGLAINEGVDKERRAIEFYDILSTFRFTSATPTLFNAGTVRPQLSSCYLSTIQDDLEHIFKVISDNARLSKWAGGIGNDWTNVRATGGLIRGTHGKTQGVVPFLKVANDTTLAVNQGGKRQGSTCAYLETWHLDIEEFLELRKNTGDDRRRTHDMNTANWIPDLFIKRVRLGGPWTLFNPCEVPDLHDLFGRAFEERYIAYERAAERGELRQHKVLQARELWRKMISMLFETGHPWITFKDPSNIRSTQSHVGVIHSSNLCTEILLNTSAAETAVCNLGSLNLAAHLDKGRLSEAAIAQTVKTAVRMLDNVIDINYYPTPEARNANLAHRPIGLGMMGFQDSLYQLRIPYDSPEAVQFADRSMEMISYYALLGSSELAKERGRYSSYAGSSWSRGLLPIDTLDILERERETALAVDRSQQMDWRPVREAIQRYGMRNSHTMAIAPTATISHICGVSPSIEPTYANLFVRSNMSGEFLSLNPFLVSDLKAAGLWSPEVLEALKYYDGSVQALDTLPSEIRRLYKTAFEIDPRWLIECASRRQKWIDMGQSLNLYVQTTRGSEISDLYLLAWEKGLKSTYYLRTQSATTVEKASVDVNRFGIQPRWMQSRSASGDIQVQRSCGINDVSCEACQ